MGETKIGPAADIPRSSLRRVLVGERRLCLVRTADGDFHVVADECTHEGGTLSDGDLFGFEIQCPLHGSSFDVRTGAVRGLPATEPVEVFTAAVEDGIVTVTAVGKTDVRPDG